eukprot:ctg_4370.g624
MASTARAEVEEQSTRLQVARGLYDFLRTVGGEQYDRSTMLADLSIGLSVFISQKEREMQGRLPALIASLERCRPCLSREQLQRLQHFARLAHGAYCTSERELFRRTPLYEGTVVRSRWSSAQERPAYYIAVDDTYRCIVLAVRGTDTMADVFTDLSLHPMPFLGGFAHAGITRS